MRATRRGGSKIPWDAQRLARETKEFEREFVADSFTEPTERALAKWQRAKRKPGRPRQGAGVRVIAVSVEGGLLKKCDAAAKRMGLSRAALISRGLREVLAAESAG